MPSIFRRRHTHSRSSSGGGGTPSAAPDNLTATGTASDITLAWDAVASVLGYNVYGATDPTSTFTLIAFVVGAVTYVHVPPDTATRYYRVTAVKSDSTESAYDGTVAMGRGTTVTASTVVAAVADLPSSTSGTLASATGTTATLVSPASIVANYYNGALLYITGGTGAGQVRRITAYTTGRVATVATWATAPDNTSTYEVLPDYVLIADYQSGLATAASIATLQTDTDDIQTRIPAALVSGRMDASIGAAAANTLTASALATDAVTEIVTAFLTTAVTESYAADGAAPSVTQALLLIQQVLTDFVISGTTNTIRKIDGSTTAATLTYNDATTPTSATRST